MIQVISPTIDEGGAKWVDWLVSGHPINKKFGRQTYQTNAFSSSVLAFSIAKQVDSKLGLREKMPNDKAMFMGSAVHALLQAELDKSFIKEREIWFSIPYAWKNLNFKEILISGHPDAHNQKSIIEYKTSFSDEADGEIRDYMRRQACLYWLILNRETGIDYQVKVVKVWLEITGVDPTGKPIQKISTTEWIATAEDKIKYSTEMIQRALEAATKLDEALGQKILARQISK